MKKSYLVVGLFAAVALTFGLSSCGQNNPPLAAIGQNTGTLGVGSFAYNQMTGSVVQITGFSPDGSTVTFRDQWGGQGWVTVNMLSPAVNCVPNVPGYCVGSQVYQNGTPVYINQVFRNGQIAVAPQFIGAGIGFGVGLSFGFYAGFHI